MDILTCEQYVLAELEDAQGRIAELLKENDRLSAQCELLQSTVNAPKDEIQALVEEEGRKSLFEKWFRTYRDTEHMSPDAWAEEAVSYEMPKGMRAKALRFFEPELRAQYAENKAKEAALREDAE